MANVEIMPLSEIRPGMIGYGLSTFQGTKIERFNIEVVDILRNFIPGDDIILIRCTPSYGNYDLAKSGLIAGMSGSPVYIHDKLIGALAYGWPYAYEAMGGVTPIETMLRITKRPISQQANAQEAIAPDPKTEYAGDAKMSLRPIATPVVVSGINSANFLKFQKLLQQHGLLAIQGPGHGGPNPGNTTSQPLVPGASLGAQLIAGDLDITAIGTATWVQGNEVLGFGHPFLGLGICQVPMTSANIAAVIATSEVSFKLGYSLETLGTLYHDRLTGVYGQIGKRCPMLPMQVHIKHLVQKTSRTFNVEMIQHHYFTPLLGKLAIANFLEAEEPIANEHTIRFCTKIFSTDTKDPIVWINQAGTRLAVETNFLEPLEKLLNNPFAKPNISQIEVSIEILPQLQTAKIIAVRANPIQVQQGENAALEIAIQPLYGEVETLCVEFSVPKDAGLGIQPLIVAGGGKVRPPQFEPENYLAYINAIQKSNQYQANHLLIILVKPQLQLACQGQTMPDLPGSMVGNLITNTSTRDIQMMPQFYIQALETQYILTGAMQLMVQILDKDGKPGAGAEE